MCLSETMKIVVVKISFLFAMCQALLYIFYVDLLILLMTHSGKYDYSCLHFTDEKHESLRNWSEVTHLEIVGTLIPTQVVAPKSVLGCCKKKELN